MQNFTTLIVDMMRKEKLFASQGGPIILAQIENEYGNVMSKYGDAGKAYVDWCAKLADSYQIGIPWLMCQQSDAPPPMVLQFYLYLTFLFSLFNICSLIFIYLFIIIVRLIHAMVGIVIILHLQIPTLLKCGLKIGPAGEVFFFFLIFF